MRPTLPLQQPTSVFEKKSGVANASNCVRVEIDAYLAARNLLLREAEQNPTEANLRRAASANEAAENCLRPINSPYEAQTLPEVEATRERQHCQAVKARLTELHGRADQQRRAA